jgi:hypothetical protein
MEEIFANLSHFNIRLNPEKSTFGIPWGKLLGYLITKHDNKVNPDKISAIVEIGQVRNVKDVQWLMGWFTALSCFVSWLGECGLPLYKLLKQACSFYWRDEIEKALDDLKALISKPPVLASPEASETLLQYIAATTQVISAALVVEQEKPGHVYKVQWPVYYISKVLSNYETRYNQVQKLLYDVLITKRKLLQYFESHPIRVIISFGLRDIVGNRLSIGRITKWALKPMELDIAYIPQTAIKSRALVDFVAECIETQQPPPVTQEYWSVYFDGSFTPNGARGGVVFISPKGDRLLYIIQLHFYATNNAKEYKALVNGLRIANELGV